VEWVRDVLGELRPFVRTEVFDHWLQTDHQGGVEDKPQIVADALQALWDIRSPTHLPVKLLVRRENAFLETVFFLKTTLAEDEKSGLSLFIRVRQALLTVRSQADRALARLSQESCLWAVPLSRFTEPINTGVSNF
jgi:hypothetical protein